MNEFLLYLYAESPLHTGAAGSFDVLDLPIQREAATGYPVIWGQSLKGALRQAAAVTWDETQVRQVFGSSIEHPGEDGGTTPGGLSVGDAQLVAMPVPTLRQTFAWLTSEIALARLARKYTSLWPHRPVPAIPQVAADSGAAVAQEWTQAAREVLGPCMIPLGGTADGELASWADKIATDALSTGEGLAWFAAKLRRDLILAGSDLVPVLLRECTEQAVRVQLNSESKTVENGPFYSEYLPAETILAAALTLRGAADTDANREALRGLLDGQLLQVGGDETLGKGLAWGRLLEAEPS